MLGYTGYERKTPYRQEQESGEILGGIGAILVQDALDADDELSAIHLHHC